MSLMPPLEPTFLEQSFGLFRLSRMVHAVTELDIANYLAAGPLNAQTLARLTNTHEPSLTTLLDSLTGWGVFTRDDQNQYGLTPFSQRLVQGAEGGANLAMLLGWVGFQPIYEAFGDILHTIRTGESAIRGRYGLGFHQYLSQNPEVGILYEKAMESTTASFAHTVDSYDFSDASLIVDVGGGQGALALEILSRFPDMRAISYDLPEVIAHAQIENHPAYDRLELVAGDAFESVPTGGDIYLTSTVLRCFNDERCVQLLKNIRAAMPDQARLVALEYIVPDQRDSLLMNTADLIARVVYGGCDRTEKQFETLFAEAGLSLRRAILTEGFHYAIEGVPG